MEGKGGVSEADTGKAGMGGTGTSREVFVGTRAPWLVLAHGRCRYKRGNRSLGVGAWQ
ncbi:unnamed protein product, partial [Ilex paraguariensis]